MKKITIVSLLIIASLTLTGCSNGQPEQGEEFNADDFLADLERWEEEKLQPICDQDLIPAEYASDCYFRTLKDCENLSDAMIPKEDLAKCMPVFLKEAIDDAYYNAL